MNIKDAEVAIKQGDISILENVGLLQRDQVDGYICPSCGSGSGPHGTGARSFINFKNYSGLKCFNCGGFFNNLDIIALAYGLHIDEGGKDYFEAVKIGCQLFGIELDDVKPSEKLKPRPKLEIENKVFSPEECVGESTKKAVDAYVWQHAHDLNFFITFDERNQIFHFQNATLKGEHNLSTNSYSWIPTADYEHLDLKKGSIYSTRYLLAKHFHMPSAGSPKDEFVLYGRICAEFDIPFKTKLEETAERKEAMLKLVHADIKSAVANIDTAPVEAWRGIPLELMRKFKFGWLDSWIHPTIRLDNKTGYPTRRLLATTPNHYEAMLIKSDRNKLKSQFDKMHTSPREPFFLDILPFTDINLIFEGAFDAVSAYYALDGKYSCYATGGVSLYNVFVEHLNKQDAKPKFVVIYDSDKSGRDKAPAFAEMLNKNGYPAVVKFLFDEESKIDANDILLSEGKTALANKILPLLQHLDFPDMSEPDEVLIAEPAPNNRQFTKDIFGTCPINLEVPVGYAMHKFGIVKLSQKGNHVITCTPLVVTRTFADDNDENGAVEIAVYNRAKNIWRKHRILKEIIASNTGVLKLAAFGVAISQKDAKWLSNFLMLMIYDGENPKLIPKCRMYKMPGWTDSACTNFIFPVSEDDSYMVGSGDVDYNGIFTPNGNKAEWTDIFKRVCKASYVTRLNIGTALAAPLIRVCGTRNLQLHLCGKSGSGKTALVKAVMSIYGDPKRLMRSFNSTFLSTEKFAIAFNDYPHAINEFQTKQRKAREEEGDSFIYVFEEGQTRAKLNRNSELREGAGEFRGARFTTGEQSLTQLSSGEGAKVRVIEIAQANIMSDELAVELHQFLDRGNYGHFGKAWIEWILATNRADKDLLFAEFKDFKNNVANYLRQAVHSHVAHIAISYFALKMFVKNVLRDDELCKFIDEKLIRDWSSLYDDTPTKSGAENATRAIDCLNEYVNVSHSGRFFFQHKDEEGEYWSDVNSNLVAAGYIFADGRVGFGKRQLVRILEDEYKFPSAEAVIRGLADKGVLILGSDPKRKYQTRVYCGKDNKQLSLVVFRDGVLL